MKKSHQIIYTLFFTLVFCSVSFSAELEKSKIKSEQSFLKKGAITYLGNVVYEHGSFLIQADELTREDKIQKKIIVKGNPAKVFYKDLKGENTEIFAPTISYWEDTGEIIAPGPVNISQTSKKDRIQLSGSQLKANRLKAAGFSFKLTGSPTQFRLKQPGQPIIEATANSLSSNGKGRQTRLTGNVKLRQGESYMAAASMVYDGEKEIISAQQSVDGTQRVETEFFWDKEEDSNIDSKDPDTNDQKETP